MYSDTRLYEASVLVNGRPVTEVIHNNQVFIEGRKNSVFTLRFKNWGWRRVLVVPAVDGLSVIDRKKCGKQSPGYVVEARSHIDIPGWTLDQNAVGKFIFKSQGAAPGRNQTLTEAIEDSEENQGAIGFMVFEEAYPKLVIKHVYQPGWSSGDFYGGGYGAGGPTYDWGNTVIGSSEVKADNSVRSENSTMRVKSSFSSSNSAMGSKLKSSSVRSARKGNVSDGAPVMDSVLYSAEVEEASLGAGIGKEVEFKTRNVDFERMSSEPQAVFTFFYDNLSNLKRMGVPVDLFKPAKQRVSANPFPASPEVAKQDERLPQWYRRRGRNRS